MEGFRRQETFHFMMQHCCKDEVMPRYQLDFIAGNNMHLVVQKSEIVEAASFAEALARKTDWPVFEARDHRSAAADNPGTSMYYTEMWEATLLDPLPDHLPESWLGDWSRMRY